MLNNGKSFFAGVGQEGRPGAIEVWRMPLERVNTFSAHSKAIERMRISHDNKFLFTSSNDGTLMIHTIVDRDPRGGAGARGADLTNFSEEILTEKIEMDWYDSTMESL
jgi:hypothetical protein